MRDEREGGGVVYHISIYLFVRSAASGVGSHMKSLFYFYFLDLVLELDSGWDMLFSLLGFFFNQSAVVVAFFNSFFVFFSICSLLFLYVCVCVFRVGELWDYGNAGTSNVFDVCSCVRVMRHMCVYGSRDEIRADICISSKTSIASSLFFRVLLYFVLFNYISLPPKK